MEGGRGEGMSDGDDGDDMRIFLSSMDIGYR